MPEHNDDHERPLVDLAWEKALRGDGLTYEESAALSRERGVYIPPTVSPTPKVAPPPVAPEIPTQTVTTNVQHLLQARPGDRDRIDLVTGETVINIPFRDPKPTDRMRISPAHLNNLPELQKRGVPADIHVIVTELDRVIMPGFLRLLTEQERAQLHAAPPTLIGKVHFEIMRAVLAGRANDMIAKISRGMDRHITPLLPRIQTPSARASIQACIDIWEANKANPYLNHYERCARSAEENPLVHTEYAAPLLERNPKYLSAAIIQGELDMQNVGAAFSDTTQVMFLREPQQQREMTFIDMLSAIHELTHKAHNARRVEQHGPRSEAFRKRGMDLPTNTMLYVADEDPEALGNEVELFIARVGTGKLETERVADTLGVSVQEYGHAINDRLKYAVKYFPRGRRPDGRATPEFEQYVESEYRRLGAQIFKADREGILRRKP